MVARKPKTDGGDAAEDSSATSSEGVGSKTQKAAPPTVKIPAAILVKQLAGLMKASEIEVIKQLMRRGVMAGINQVIDYETAATIVADFGFLPKPLEEPKVVGVLPVADGYTPSKEEDPDLLQPRAPVVTILGHVDHGKTTLLDVIRKSSVASSEKGGITQHIGAYQVEVDGQRITFLDTPGHEAFTAMRARGAQVTDIAVLVVAADDGVMPQTREAIDHAKAADVPIVVAINKIDKPEANADRVKQQLADLGLVVEEWGGDTIMVPVSAKTEEGVLALLENILLVSEISELKANPDRRAQGVVVEAKLDTARGAVATVLVKSGTLKVGDTFSVGDTHGKVRALFDDKGQQTRQAGPSAAVEVLGIESVPRAGDTLIVEENGRRSRSSIERDRRRKNAEAGQIVGGNNTEQLLAQANVGEAKDLNLILKTDVEGSGEAIRSSVERLANDEVKVKIIRTGSGVVTESDVLLAAASDATILAFNTRADAGAKRSAELEGVTIRHYDVIYDLITDMQAAVSGLVEPVYQEVVEAEAVVKEVFKVKGGKAAGIGVTDGKINRNAQVRVIREGAVIHTSSIKSLQHFKDAVRELTAGSEGGIGVEGFDDFEAGDTIETFRREEVESLPR